ncbi:hypothetical protein K040078D81_47440 [Blautia hominis]|uniref:Uncharacterized protein n=1 Tax=Blautia hominis TaxID=2025493 RepID=A0ABQ0BGP0_9FIRM
MTKEKWIEICKEMAPHLRALELIAKNNALDIVTIALGTETTGHAVWIEDDTGSHYRCVSDGDNDFKAEIGNMKTYSEFPVALRFALKKPLEPASNQGLDNNISSLL